MVRRSASLTRQTLWMVAVRISIVLAIATVVSYWHVLSGLETQALGQLEDYVEQRRARESSIFTLAGEHLDLLTEAFQRRLARTVLAEADARFERLFETRPDGTTRLREQVFAEQGLTAFIGKHVPIDQDLRRRLIAAFDVLAQYGPAWRSRFVNLYVVTPENAVLMYWPDQPWALHASDWEVQSKLALLGRPDEGVLVVGPDAPAPEGGQRWSELYFDYGVNDWMVSAIEPVIEDGRHLLSAGHDILLRDLIQRALSGEVEGTYNILFSADGRLIAHPRFMEAIQAQSGSLTIAETGDAHLTRVFELTQARTPGQIVVENDADAEFLAISPLSGPVWYLVTVFPKALVANQAFDTARLILLLGAIALLLEIGILYMVLKRQVAAPLGSLIRATRRLASGRFDGALDVAREDEIGQLARSFNDMAQQIDSREAALHERSGRLAEVNAQLERELAERLRAEAEVARQREALHQSEKLNALGSLLAGVAHELNNPLSVVVGRAGLLAEDLRNSPHAASLAAVRAAADRCGKIIRTFVALARQEQPSRRPVDIAEVIRSTLDIVSFGFRRHQIEVRLELAPRLSELPADPNQLVQVFANLLINAQHALAACPPPRWVRISTAVDPGARALKVQVEDNGPGIPKEIIGRIFEPFFTTKPVGQGTGLGLSLCRGLIEAHGGTIEVCLPAGGGTRFDISLPLEASTALPELPELRAPSAPRGRSILIVDDEPEVAEMLAEVLAPLGCRVEIAHGGRAALDRLASARFDLVLTDIRMPDVDGRQLYRALTEHDKEHAPRVVFISGDSLSDATITWVEETARPVVEKPFTPEDVRRVVAIELRRSERHWRETTLPAGACQQR